MTLKNNLTFKEWVFIAVTILSGGIAWGRVTARLDSQDEKVNALVAIPQSVAALNEHIIAVDKRTSDIQQDVRDIKNYLLK